jgi:ElaB/YqjD/DUF883 family membrane-anchored ribosome-binding protein
MEISIMKTNVDKPIRSAKDETSPFGQTSENSNISDSYDGNGAREDDLRSLKDDFGALKLAFADLASDMRSVSSHMATDAASKVAKSVNENASAISGSVSKTVGAIAGSAADVARTVSANATQTASNIADGVSDAGATISKHATDLSNQATSSAKSVSAEIEAFTQRSPTLALACAVGVGLLLGNLARTRR